MLLQRRFREHAESERMTCPLCSRLRADRKNKEQNKRAFSVLFQSRTVLAVGPNNMLTAAQALVLVILWLYSSRASIGSRPGKLFLASRPGPL